MSDGGGSLKVWPSQLQRNTPAQEQLRSKPSLLAPPWPPTPRPASVTAWPRLTCCISDSAPTQPEPSQARQARAHSLKPREAQLGDSATTLWTKWPSWGHYWNWQWNIDKFLFHDWKLCYRKGCYCLATKYPINVCWTNGNIFLSCSLFLH